MKNKKQVYKLLERGYFSFPLKDKGKKFEVVDSLTVYFKDKSLSDSLKKVKKYSIVPIQIYEEIFWKAIKQEKLDKKFKNCWIVPVHLSEYNGEFVADLDILKPVR